LFPVSAEEDLIVITVSAGEDGRGPSVVAAANQGLAQVEWGGWALTNSAAVAADLDFSEFLSRQSNFLQVRARARGGHSWCVLRSCI
jgi:hypothetical protein